MDVCNVVPHYGLHNKIDNVKHDLQPYSAIIFYLAINRYTRKRQKYSQTLANNRPVDHEHVPRFSELMKSFRDRVNGNVRKVFGSLIENEEAKLQ